MKCSNRIYIKVRNYLAKHPKPPLILSHGFLHFVVLLALLIVAIILYNSTKEMSTIEVSQINISYQESLHNYEYSGIKGEFFLNQIDTSWIQINTCMRPVFDAKRKDSVSAEPSIDPNYKFSSAVIDDETDWATKHYNLKKHRNYYSHGIVVITSNECKLKRLGDKSDENIDWFYPNYDAFNDTLYAEYFSTDTIHHNTKKITLIGDDLFKSGRNSPVKALWIGISAYKSQYANSNNLEYIDPFERGRFDIYYGYEKITNSKQSRFERRSALLKGDKLEQRTVERPFEIRTVIPEPDIITPFYISYNSAESQKRILQNGGIYLQVQDIDKQNEVDLRMMQYTILIGAIIAFMLDIIVNLILKWRRLAKKIQLEDEKDKNKLEN